MQLRSLARSSSAAALVVALVLPAAPAAATPVCTDGFEGGPPLVLCGGRVFPEAANTLEMIQYGADPVTGFQEWRHGMEYLEQQYPRWIQSFTLREYYENDLATSMGFDGIRPYESGDSGDGFDIFVVKVTDFEVPDEGKDTLLFSLSVHGDEKGGLEGGARAIEDLVTGAENGGTIVDGIAGYPSSTGIDPVFKEYEIADVLAQQAVYFIDFNPDGWVAGDILSNAPGGLYTRGNAAGVDLNRQMPTIGRISRARSPLQESEAYWGHEFMTEVARAGKGGLMAYGADIHGEGQSRAFADIMYPAGQFDSIKHRQMMSIAERTKSVIDATLYEGLVDVLEEQAFGGDTGEGIEDLDDDAVIEFIPNNTVPVKPARWGTVWDTLNYTDTGFIGDYLASQLGVTGMDYEIALNHTDVRAYGRPWSVLLQENWINASRAIVETAMAYAITQPVEFADFEIDPLGQVAYLANPDRVEGFLYGISYDEQQQHTSVADNLFDGEFSVSNTQFFEDLSASTKGGIAPVGIADIANDPAFLDGFDTLAIADIAEPNDVAGRAFDRADYLANLQAWVERGGNLVLTDRALHLLAEFGIVGESDVQDIRVYQPYANFVDVSHPMAAGLRGNARQLSEATLIGYEIGADASPMTVVTTTAFEAAGGEVVGTTEPGAGGGLTGPTDDGSLTSIGELPVGEGKIRIMGGGLAMPTTEVSEHPYGLRDYSVTYSGLYIMENSIIHDAAALGGGGAQPAPAPAPEPTPEPTPEPAPAPLPATGGGLAFAGLGMLGAFRVLRRSRS